MRTLWGAFAASALSTACGLGEAGDGSPATGDDAGATETGAAATGPGEGGSTASDGGGATREGGPSPGVDGGTAHGDGGPGTDAAPALPAIEFAPYFPTWTWGGGGYPYSSLVDLQQKASVNDVTIAFVLSGGGCVADQGIEQNLADVKAFLAAGGHVKVSFGGADGTYVESQCADAASFAKALEDFVDATGITDLDFDIEQDPVLTDAVNQLRGDALAMAQASRGIEVAFTLAANPDSGGSGGGLTAQGLSVVSHALASGVHVSHVNLMTMDYGDGFGGQPLAPVAIGSLTDANAQLVGLGLSTTEAWRTLGVTAMIGKNDDSEVFSLDDARTVAAFAIQNRLGLVSFWSIDRDQICPSGADYNTCSTVNTSNFQFSGIFQTVTTH